MIVEALAFRESGRRPDEIEYSIVLRESPPPPPPADPLAGLDAGLLDDAAGFVDSVTGALDAIDAMSAAGLLRPDTAARRRARRRRRRDRRARRDVTGPLAELFGESRSADALRAPGHRSRRHRPLGQAHASRRDSSARSRRRSASLITNPPSSLDDLTASLGDLPVPDLGVGTQFTGMLGDLRAAVPTDISSVIGPLTTGLGELETTIGPGLTTVLAGALDVVLAVQRLATMDFRCLGVGGSAVGERQRRSATTAENGGDPPPENGACDAGRRRHGDGDGGDDRVRVAGEHAARPVADAVDDPGLPRLRGDAARRSGARHAAAARLPAARRRARPAGHARRVGRDDRRRRSAPTSPRRWARPATSSRVSARVRSGASRRTSSPRASGLPTARSPRSPTGWRRGSRSSRTPSRRATSPAPGRRSARSTRCSTSTTPSAPTSRSRSPTSPTSRRASARSRTTSRTG